MTPPAPAPPARRVLLLGATGTIGRATARELVTRGHYVVCPVRRSARTLPELDGAQLHVAEAASAGALARDAIRAEDFDVLISCLASRTGVPADAWAIDHAAHVEALAAAQAAGIGRMIQLSAICVQTPRLAFQHAKLAFEAALMQSGLDWTIVRPTAFFKSLSGQVERVRRGKPFMVFGDGRLTACKPISDRDLATFLADCIDAPARINRVLPIGGPGPAITPRDQGEMLFELTGRPARFTHVPVRMLDAVIAALDAGGRVSTRLAAKAELARIGRYYATESMLVRDEATGAYDADATPAFGNDRLRDHYARLIAGEVDAALGDHAVF